MKGRYGSRIERRHAALADDARVERDRRAHGVRVDAEIGDDGADLPVFAEIESADLGVLLGRDHDAASGDTRRIGQGGGRSHALSRPQTIQRSAPTRGAVGKRSVDVSASQCAKRRRAAGSLIPHARAICALMIPMIEAAFSTGPMAAAGGADRPAGGPPCDRPSSNTRGRDRTRRRSRRGGCSADTFSGEAVYPRRRSGDTLQLDTPVKPWHKESRLARSVGASRRSPRVWRVQLQALTSSATDAAYATTRRRPTGRGRGR